MKHDEAMKRRRGLPLALWTEERAEVAKAVAKAEPVTWADWEWFIYLGNHRITLFYTYIYIYT